MIRYLACAALFTLSVVLQLVFFNFCYNEFFVPMGLKEVSVATVFGAVIVFRALRGPRHRTEPVKSDWIEQFYDDSVKSSLFTLSGIASALIVSAFV